MYNFDDKEPAGRDCPKCRRTMQSLARYNAIERNEGYSIDDGTGGNNLLTYVLFGWMGVIIRLFTREVLAPIMNKSAGERRQSKYATILKVSPRTLICPHCKHLIRRK